MRTNFQVCYIISATDNISSKPTLTNDSFILLFTKACQTDSYKCADGSCIDRRFICDGKIDCKTSIDDEQYCGEYLYLFY